MEKKRRIQIAVIAVVVLLLLLWYFLGSGTKNEEIIYNVKKGDLVVSVVTSGELEAQNSVPIMGPTNLRKMRIWQIKIDDLIDEGTIVRKGDYVGALSKSEVLDKLSEEQSQLLKQQSQQIQTKLDTTIELSQARNEIRNMEYTLKEKEIVVEQSKYEPPATIRQAKNDLARTRKSLNDLVKNYALKKRKATAKMNEVLINLNVAQRKITQIEEILDDLTIHAPDNGMVIYKRDWNGKKYKVGSMIGTWSPVVATLPDLSKMISKTFVNEVDISRVKVDQKVTVRLDAFPDQKLTGVVSEVSNIGQQNPNSDGKVFEVTVTINEQNDQLRPAMTTSNNIVQEKIENTLIVPIEAVHSQGDSISYVFNKGGFGVQKSEIKIGKSNADFSQVINGLEEGSEILLSVPENSSDLSLKRL